MQCYHPTQGVTVMDLTRKLGLLWIHIGCEVNTQATLSQVQSGNLGEISITIQVLSPLHYPLLFGVHLYQWVSHSASVYVCRVLSRFPHCAGYWEFYTQNSTLRILHLRQPQLFPLIIPNFLPVSSVPLPDLTSFQSVYHDLTWHPTLFVSCSLPH